MSGRGGGGFTRVGFCDTAWEVGARVVWGGATCVALAGGEMRAQGQNQGDAQHKASPFPAALPALISLPYGFDNAFPTLPRTTGLRRLPS